LYEHEDDELELFEEAEHPDAGKVDRAARQSAFLLATVRKIRWVSFWSVDANVIDLNLNGVKISFAFDIRAKPGQTFWIIINHPKAEECQNAATVTVQAQCRWYDPNEYTVGAVLDVSSESIKTGLQSIIDTLREMGRTSQ